MPRAINGIGTFYYGKEDVRPDGSYVTTEYAIFFYLPVLPLRSCRVRLLDRKDPTALQALGALFEMGAAETREAWEVLEVLPIRAGQAVETLAKGWILAPLLILWPLAVMVVLGRLYGVRGSVKVNGIPPVVMIPCGIAAFVYAILMAAQVLGKARKGS